MSKAIGKVLGAGGTPTSMYGSENGIINYLNNYDTSNYDTTIKNLASYAANASNLLNNMGNYTFNVNASDTAMQEAQNATFQSYMAKLSPQFANQTNELAASLANKGISIGSQAYSKAMTDLQNSQNEAINQAAYQSVLAGQNAFSNNLNNQIASANFANNAQNNYINQLLNALQKSYSGYDIAMDKYKIQNGADSRISQAQHANATAQQAVGDQFLSSAIKAGTMALLSDKRLKENIKPVGKLDNGLTVYCFNFKGSNLVQLGLIAQEVATKNPEAVSEGGDGFLRVNYELACR